jgi:GAF domain-containing protein
MAENLFIPENISKTDKYEALIPQIKALCSGETDLIANLANTTAALHETFDWLWTGFYLVKGNELVLGPFQGPLACTRIKFGKGVCGTAWKEKRSLLVPNVEKFPGHIACSSLSVSEIVVPIISKTGDVFGVLDVDSKEFGVLDEIDEKYLQVLCRFISEIIGQV